MEDGTIHVPPSGSSGEDVLYRHRRLFAYSALPRTAVLAGCPSAVQERRVQGKEVWELFQSSTASLAVENVFKNMFLFKVRCVSTAGRYLC